MIPPLADITPTPEALASWLAVLTYLCVTIAAVVVAWRYVSGRSDATVIKPQPLIVKGADDFATKPELAGLAKKMDDELGRERSARKRIHEEIAGLQGEVKVLANQGEYQSRQLNNLDNKMDQVLMRLPRPPSS